MGGILWFLCLLLSATSLPDATAWIGVNYGRIADNLPPPPKVVELLKSQGINRVKIFDTDATVLSALANSGISVVVCIPNLFISAAAANQVWTDMWVESNITKYYPATKIEAIAVGNEVFVDPTNSTKFLVPAMKNLYASLQKHKLGDAIKISSPIAYTAIAVSFPMSAGTFRPDLIDTVMKPMLDFIRQTKSYLMVNVYPFFAYAANSDQISLDYSVFQHNAGTMDTANGNVYSSLFVAQVDAVYAAMSALKYDDVKLVVTETGWPSKGDDNEIGATVQVAAAYNGNLVRRVLTGCGTPLRPLDQLNVFIFALFNENQKTGPTSERNYGLFYPNQQKVYTIPFTPAQAKTMPHAPVGGSNVQAPSPPSSPSSDGQRWCVAKDDADEAKLEAGLKYACGEGGADCGPIQPGSTCFNPNTIKAHASYAFNSFYQKKARADDSCDFDGAASVIDQPPKYGNCQFPTGSDSGTPPSSGTPSSNGQTWCVAKKDAGEAKLEAGLKYACGEGGADCSPIQQGSTCYNPNTLEAHASYAFNSFYQKKARADGSCDFDGAANVVDQPPQYGECKFPTGPDNGTPPSTGTPSDSGTTPSTGTPSDSGQTWCVAKKNVEEAKLEAGLKYACGQGGADCGPIQSGSTCFNPNTLEAHASYAFNSFYQKKARADGSCDFGGAANVVDQPPKYGDCQFPTGPDSGTPPSTGTPSESGTSPESGTPSSNGQTWCVAKKDADKAKLEAGLKYACGDGGADCGPIQPGSTCFNPNTLEAHASYAFNSLYQNKARADGSCNFNGVANIVDQPPQYGECKFPTGPSSRTPSGSGTPPSSGTPSGTGTPPSTGTPSDSGTPPSSGTPPATETPSSQGQTWCVADVNAGPEKLQGGLEFACGVGGADCGSIQPGATCYNPNTLEAHASYAFNSYYQKKARVDGSCTFGGAAYIVTQPPKYGDCVFPTGSSSETPSSSGTPSGSGTPSSNGTPSSSGTPLGSGTPSSSGTPSGSGTPSSQGDMWCVAKPDAGPEKLKAGLEYACGQGGADCGPIQSGSSCYNPNTLEAHASYAFNSYYQKKNRASGTCDFGGAAFVSVEIPMYGKCEFPTKY